MGSALSAPKKSQSLARGRPAYMLRAHGILAVALLFDTANAQLLGGAGNLGEGGACTMATFTERTDGAHNQESAALPRICCAPPTRAPTEPRVTSCSVFDSSSR